MIRLIAATDNKRGLAKNGQIPWNLPADKTRFRTLTLEHGATVLMGRATYEQMGDYLKDHSGFVVSHSQLQLPANYQLVSDLDSFMAGSKEDLWVIGGAAIYAGTIKYADELYMTIIEADFNCDQFFPDYSGFKLKSSEDPLLENNLKFSYQLLTRVTPALT
ncbi:MAG TPA: dihydrofolate reductase [Candidatus Saccharimonadales bacterium]|jgi:dihydrofolate reductase